MSLLSGPELVGLLDWMRHSSLQASLSEPEHFLQAYQSHMTAAAPGLALYAGLRWLADAIISTAIIRASLNPEQSRFAYLRFGGAELLQMGVVIAINITLFAICAIVMMVIVATSLIPVLGQVLGLLSPVLVGIAVFWAMLRLCLSWSASYDGRRLDLGTSIRLTRGREATLFTGFIIVGLCIMAVSTALFFIFILPLGLMGMNLVDIMPQFSPDLKSLTALIQPTSALSIAYMALSLALSQALLVGAATSAYRQLSQKI